MSLACEGVSAGRGERMLFSGVSFELHGGEALWLRGANGSGKTTLLRILCGLGVPLAGEVRWCREPVRQLREYFHRHLLYVGHASGLKDDLLAWENLAAGAALAGTPCTRAEAIEALGTMGLGAQAALPARALSQGQRRRVALARLCLGTLPDVVVLDEPWSALDSAASSQLAGRLDAHLRGGGMLVYTTHQPVALGAAGLRQFDLDTGRTC